MLDNDAVVPTRGSLDDLPIDKRRRLPDAPKKSFEATQMWDVYQEIARRVVLGQKNVDIAEDLGVTPVMVSYVRNSPIIQEKIQNLQELADADTVSVAKRIKNLAPHAMKLLEDMIVSGKVGNEQIPAKLRVHHAEKALDRAGHAAPKEVRNLNLSAHYTADDLEQIKARALAAGRSASVVVEDTSKVEDAEFEEEDKTNAA